ncbi:MAG: C1 family peptidase [Lachnotalea sp.]
MKKQFSNKALSLALVACLTLNTFHITALAKSVHVVEDWGTANATDNTTVIDDTASVENVTQEEVTEEVAEEESVDSFVEEQTGSSEELSIIDENTTDSENVSQEDDSVYTTNYQSDDFVIPSVDDSYMSNYSTYSADSTESTEYAESLPSSFSSKDSLPVVRDQGGWGVCWSFAAIGAAEASIITKGLGDKSIDLSELQLAYFFYNSVTDPLGNTIGDNTQTIEKQLLECRWKQCLYNICIGWLDWCFG